jgi:ArsR family transcriptional regulator
MLQGAQARIENAGIATDHISFIEGELNKLPLGDGSVDAAVCMLVAHHLSDPIESMREMRRIVTNERGGGVVLVVDMYAHSNEDYRRVMGHAHLGFHHEQITDMLKEAGFERVLVNPLRPDVNSSGPPLFAAVAWI